MGLEILGIDALTERVYRMLLRSPEADLATMAASLAEPEDRIREALDRLADLALVRRNGRGPFYFPVNPEIALDALLSLEQAELSRRERELLQARVELARLVSTSNPRLRPTREVQRLGDVGQVVGVLRDLAGRCYQEVLSVVPTDGMQHDRLKDARAYDLALLDRGVRCRLLYARSHTAEAVSRRYLEELQCHGAEVRIAQEVPHRLVVFDRAVSFLPIDPRRPATGALLVREPAIIANLVTLFESLWAKAPEFDRAVEGDQQAASELDRDVLLMMSSGVKDEAAARQLNVSHRTYRRHVAEIMTRLGATSRFQAGVEAVRRGWL